MRLNKKIRRLFTLGAAYFLLTYAAPVDAFVFQDRVETTKSLAHYAMGYMYDLLGQTNWAALEYEKASQFDEGSYLIHLRLGADYARLDMLSKAEEHLLRVGQYNPEDLQAHYLLALIYSTEKEYDLAAQEYEYILKSFSTVDPQNIEIYGYLGQLYYSQRKYDQAIKQFEMILALEPANPDVMYLLGSLYLENGDVQKSIDVLKRAIEGAPNHDGCLNTLGYLYAEENMNLDEAKDLVERALTVDPYNGAYLDSLGWVYYKQGDYQNALKTLERADVFLKDPLIYDHLGDVYLKMNRVDDAIQSWERALEMNSEQDGVREKLDQLKNAQALK